MDITELKERLKNLNVSEIKFTRHAGERVQDVRRGINFKQIKDLITSQKGLYKLREQKAKKKGELKFKLWFMLNYIYDMNVYIAINEKPTKKGLNRLVIISAHKVKRKVQESI